MVSLIETTKFQSEIGGKVLEIRCTMLIVLTELSLGNTNVKNSPFTTLAPAPYVTMATASVNQS